MKLHQLSVFRAVCETGSFSQAAARMQLAQSAVSYHIKALEKTIGSPLFRRVRTKVQLTQKGKRLAGHAERILELISEVERDMLNFRDQ